MAEHAHPILVLFDHTGRPLHLGRARRLASTDQRLALIATEGGCSKPGCTVPADQCQTHHAHRSWADGGHTNIDELTLACTGHHAQITTGPHGWTTRIGGNPRHPGRCAWTAPKHLGKPPQTNHFHHPGDLLHRAPSRSHGAEPP